MVFLLIFIFVIPGRYRFLIHCLELVWFCKDMDKEKVGFDFFSVLLVTVFLTFGFRRAFCLNFLISLGDDLGKTVWISVWNRTEIGVKM